MNNNFILQILFFKDLYFSIGEYIVLSMDFLGRGYTPFATFKWNTCNIQFEHLEHLKHADETPATSTWPSLLQHLLDTLATSTLNTWNTFMKHLKYALITDATCSDYNWNMVCVAIGMKTIGNDRSEAKSLSFSFFFSKTKSIQYCRKRIRCRYFGNFGKYIDNDRNPWERYPQKR
jgi:hypothetical protein